MLSKITSLYQQYFNSKLMALKDKDLDSFNKILYDVFDMDKQKSWNRERRAFAQEIEKGLVSKGRIIFVLKYF